MNTFTRTGVLLISLLQAPTTFAEDIDLFKGGGTLDPAPPNVLIYLDNTSNWSANNQAWNKTDVQAKCAGNPTCLGYVTQIFSNNSRLTQGEVEVSSLKLVLNELVCKATTPIKLNVGLMLIKPSKGTYSNNAGTTTQASGKGGLLRRAVRLLDASRCTTLLGDLDTILSNITNPAYKAPSDANYSGALFDAFKYYGGYTNPAGTSSGSAGSPTGHIGFGPKRFGTASTLEEALAFTETAAPYLT